MITEPVATAARAEDHAESIADVAALIRAEYEEMPGLALTGPQLCRLFAIDPITCTQVVQKLIDAGVLALSAKGCYIRRRSVM